MFTQKYIRNNQTLPTLQPRLESRTSDLTAATKTWSKSIYFLVGDVQAFGLEKRGIPKLSEIVTLEVK